MQTPTATEQERSICANSPAAPNFNHLARLYRWLEYFSFGPLLQRSRTRFLTNLAGCRKALVLGDGDGRFSEKLLQANQDIEITAIDGSAGMIEALRRRTAHHASRVNTCVADLRTWRPSVSQPSGQPFDLVVSHFFLDCLTTGEISDLAGRLGPFLAPNTLWLISEFAIPQSPFGRVVAAPLVSFLYRIFGLLTKLERRRLPDHANALSAKGWRCRLRDAQIRGLLISELWELPQPDQLIQVTSS